MLMRSSRKLLSLVMAIAMVASGTALSADISSDSNVDEAKLYSSVKAPSELVTKTRYLVKSQANNLGTTITFSENPVNTSITDQYASQGVVFSGDIPFITMDGANPTSPVLSGSPRFEGAIEAKFVDPDDPTKVLPVSSFSLDAGYFDDLSSTELSWYDAAGTKLGSIRDKVYGIEHMSVSGEGIASFIIKIVSTERNGFAIDNVSFVQKEVVFNHQFDFDTILHDISSDSSDAVSVYFKNLEAINGADVSTVCTDYTMNLINISQTLSGTCELNTLKTAFKVSFDLPTNKIEDADFQVCSDATCKTLDDVDGISVYGTDFETKKNGYAFNNGAWLSKSGCKQGGQCSAEQIATQANFVTIANTLRDMAKPANKDEMYDLFTPAEFGGVCHGMSTTAIAAYNNSSDKIGWDSNLAANLASTKTLKSFYERHWADKVNVEAKPLTDTIYSYKTTKHSDISNAVSQIHYYFASQAFFENAGNGIGSYTYEPFASVASLKSHYVNKFKKDQVADFLFRLYKFKFFSNNLIGGHSVIATQYIEFNNSAYLTLHDNNFPGTYNAMPVNALSTKVGIISPKKNKRGKAFDAFGDYGRGIQYSQYDKFHTFSRLTTDPLFFYSKSGTVNSQSNEYYAFSNQEGNSLVNIDSINHINIRVSGANITSVQADEKAVPVRPIIDRLDTDKAYRKTSNIVQDLYLPYNTDFTVNLENFSEVPMFDVYIKSLGADGSVQVINYTDLDKQEVDGKATLNIAAAGTFTLNKEGADPVTPTDGVIATLNVQPIVNLSGTYVDGEVKLMWDLPPNYSPSEVVVRRSNSAVTEVTSGFGIYNGLGNTVIDSYAGSNKEYYYTVFAVSNDGKVSTPETLYINTHQAGILGYVSDTEGKPVGGVRVSLTDASGSVGYEIDNTWTDAQGRYAFSGLSLGDFNLTYSKEHAVIDTPTDALTIDTPNGAVLSKSITMQKRISMFAPDSVKDGEAIQVTWSLDNFSAGADLIITVRKNGQSYTVNNDVQADDGMFEWTEESVSEDTEIEVTISSIDDDTVSSQSSVLLMAKPQSADVPVEKNTGDSSGGGGFGFGLLLILSALLLLRRK